MQTLHFPDSLAGCTRFHQARHGESEMVTIGGEGEFSEGMVGGFGSFGAILSGSCHLKSQVMGQWSQWNNEIGHFSELHGSLLCGT